MLFFYNVQVEQQRAESMYKILFYSIFILFILALLGILLYASRSQDNKNHINHINRFNRQRHRIETFDSVINGSVDTSYNEIVTGLPALAHLKLYLSAFSAKSFLPAIQGTATSCSTANGWIDISSQTDHHSDGRLVTRDFSFAQPPDFVPLVGFLLNTNMMIGPTSHDLEPDRNADISLSWYASNLNSTASDKPLVLFKSYANTQSNNGFEIVMSPAIASTASTASTATAATAATATAIPVTTVLLTVKYGASGVSVWNLPINLFQTSTPVLSTFVKSGTSLNLYIGGNSMATYLQLNLSVALTPTDSQFVYSNLPVEINPNRNWNCYLGAVVYHDSAITLDNHTSLKNHLDLEQSGQPIRDLATAAALDQSKSLLTSQQSQNLELQAQLQGLQNQQKCVADPGSWVIKLRSGLLESEASRSKKDHFEGGEIVNRELEDGLSSESAEN